MTNIPTITISEIAAYACDDPEMTLEDIFQAWEIDHEDICWQFSKPERLRKFRGRKHNNRHTRKYNFLTLDGIYDWPFKDGSKGRKFFKRQTSKRSRVNAQQEIEDQLDQDVEVQIDLENDRRHEEQAEYDAWLTDQEMEEVYRRQEEEEIMFEIEDSYDPIDWSEFDDNISGSPFDPLDELYLDI